MGRPGMNIKECAAWLRSRDGYLIISHHRPDGDALGSAAGLCRGLRLLGKRAYILENPQATDRYIPYLREYYAGDGFQPRYIVAVDLADEGIIQVNAADLKGRVDLAIDHHPSNTGYAGELLLMGERAACGEIIYLLLMDLLGSIDRETATLLYIAVTTDTGCFRYKNTNPDTLRIGAALMEAGAPVDLNRRLFMKKKRTRLILEGSIISGLEFFQDGEACIGTITLAELERIGATESDMEDIAVVAGSVEGVECSCTLRQVGERQWKVSVRTGEYENASAICGEFGGGGHGMAAGGTVEGTLEEAKAIVRAAVSKHWHENKG